jgi:hypothetical protein
MVRLYAPLPVNPQQIASIADVHQAESLAACVNKHRTNSMGDAGVHEVILACFA